MTAAILTEAPAEAPARTARGVMPHGGWRLGVPFVLLHLSCIAVIWVGWSPVAVGFCAFTYFVRMFGITAFYHRCFSHRAFRVSRGVQFAGAVVAASAAQRGPLWWTAHHRRHHRATDRPGDPHSPVQDTFAYSHVFWMFAPANQATDLELVEDLAAFPELRVLDRFHHLVPAVGLLAMLGLGYLLAALWPGLHTSGPQLLVWGFSISTVFVYQATFAVNSFGHKVGRRRFETHDASHNNWWLALVTLGEGWHNNHHRFPAGARSGFRFWELDGTWLALCVLHRLGLVRDLRPVPASLLTSHRRAAPQS
ncbi:MAG: acyl-CoA desaturase [Acidimicrobiales bacterium]